MIKVKDSDHIRIFGYGGNAAPELDYPLYQIENTLNFTLSNLISRTRFNAPNGIAGPGRHPSEWNIVKEVDPNGQSISTPPFERPVIYKRGNALAAPIVSLPSDTSSGGGGGNGGNSAPGSVNPGLSVPINTATTTATSTATATSAIIIATTTEASSTYDVDERVSNTQPIFTKPLKLKSEGEEVKNLQIILNSLGFAITKQGPGSPGHETTFFGSLTREAVKKFQCQRNIVCQGNERTTGWGMVGPKTRAKLNEIGNNQNQASKPPEETPQQPQIQTNPPESAATISAIQKQIGELQNQMIEILNRRIKEMTGKTNPN